MKYECLACGHQFNQLGKTYAGIDLWCTNAIGACPQCLADDYVETDLQFTVPAPITVMPVSTANLEAQARKVLARRSDDGETYRRDMVQAGRGRLLK